MTGVLKFFGGSTTTATSWLALGVALSVAGPASAQEQPQQKHSQEASSDTEEIVVTANKREENLQDTATSITAVSSLAIQSRGITDPGQLAGIAPGVSIQPSFILLTYIRGLGNYSSQPGVDQTTAYNVDGIYVSKPYGMPTILFDQARLELARGPQGTLQGRNATAGSLNFVSNRPTHDFEARVAGSYGNYDEVTLEGMVNLPIGDNVALRLSAASAEHGPYFRNGYGDKNVSGARARLLITPTERLEILVTGEYTRRKELGSTYSPCPPGSTAAQGCAGVTWDPWAGTPGQGTSDILNQAEPNTLESKSQAVYAEVNYDLDFATLTWVPNYRKFYYKNNQTLSEAFGYAPAVHNETHSQELRLASNPGSPFTWVFGAYWAEERADEQNYFLTARGPSITVNRPGYPSIGHVYFKNDIYDYYYRSQSLFGQVTVPLGQSFRVVGGLRYTEDTKRQSGNTGIVTAAPITGAPVLNSVDVKGSLSTSNWNYKIGAEFDVNPDVMIYANYSTGYKAGGVNGLPPGTNLSPTFAPEEIKAVQGGIKSRFMDGKVQINAEAFHYDYTGYQTSALPVVNGILLGLTTNSQSARLYGGEVEATLRLTSDDRFDLAMTVLSAKHKVFDVPAAGLLLSGKDLQNAPHFTLYGNYYHTFRFKSGADVVAHAELQHEGRQYVDFRQSPGSLTGPTWRLGADITYTAPDRNWSVGAFIRNITNDDTLLVSNSGLGPYNLATPYPPRTYGVRASANF
ncbi:TonB-dependent receptor [Sphingobium nicotianae]|uniref:TonB-dependent receptor n=1 Tax=Sphingobium nicotianae TaxID=2782607 RepID=A0A9X1D9W9_9SPHN|nr:TonB-dependent receptor [Sphingobium nicotianae]MBT2186079.1 TonB-dependent receptor [Sphingobium nicotianae]